MSTFRGFSAFPFNLFLIIAYFTTQTLAADECPGLTDGWIDGGDLGCYKFLSDQVDRSWFSAKLACEQENGYLAELQTSSASNFIGGISVIFPDVSSWFIGLTDLEEEGTWKWFLSNAEVSDAHWGPDRPNSVVPNNDDCVTLSVSNGEIVWVDGSCSVNVLGAAPLCQFGQPAASSTPAAPSTSALSSTPAASSTSSPSASSSQAALSSTASPSTSPNSPSPTSSQCSDGWNEFETWCYLYQKGPFTWAQAESFCFDQGGHLASIGSVDEDDFVKYLALFGNGQAEAFWLGGKRVGTASGEWSDGSEFVYSHYTSAGNDGDCIYQGGDFGSGWRSATCSASAPIVCKK